MPCRQSWADFPPTGLTARSQPHWGRASIANVVPRPDSHKWRLSLTTFHLVYQQSPPCYRANKVSNPSNEMRWEQRQKRGASQSETHEVKLPAPALSATDHSARFTDWAAGRGLGLLAAGSTWLKKTCKQSKCRRKKNLDPGKLDPK